MSATTYETADEFLDAADWPMYVLADGEYQTWLVWSTEDGDWFAVRPMSEDDQVNDDDPYRPVGPVALETLPLPWIVAATDEVLVRYDEDIDAVTIDDTSAENDPCPGHPNLDGATIACPLPRGHGAVPDLAHPATGDPS